MTFPEMMEVWTQNATLGAEHKLLARYVGDWDVIMKSWIDPSQPPMESTGRSTFSMILDGRIRTEDYEGDAMGMPFKGWGLTGFDNLTQKFWMTWADTMSTSIWCSQQGAFSDDKKVLTFPGIVNKAVDREVGVKMKDVYHYLSGGHFIFETWESRADGTDRKTLEIHYTRK